jgi:hypothetical protein
MCTCAREASWTTSTWESAWSSTFTGTVEFHHYGVGNTGVKYVLAHFL